jgi:hypothetical protein
MDSAALGVIACLDGDAAALPFDWLNLDKISQRLAYDEFMRLDNQSFDLRTLLISTC